MGGVRWPHGHPPKPGLRTAIRRSSSEPPDPAATQPPTDAPTGSEPGPAPPAAPAPSAPAGSRLSGAAPSTPGRHDQALVIVSVLAGSALFFSGWTLGQQALLDERHPAGRGRGVPAVLGHLLRDRRPVCRRAGRSAGAGPGRDQVDVRRARRPVLAVPEPRRSSRARCRASPASSRGSAPRSGPSMPRGNTTIVHDAGHRLPSGGRRSRWPGLPPSRRASRPGDMITAVDGSSLDGLTVNAARDLIRGPRDTTVRLTIVARDGAPHRGRRSCAP